MAGRGPQSFKKRQKEQARKEQQQEKIAKRLERKRLGPLDQDEEEEPNPLDQIDKSMLPDLIQAGNSE
jgi:hypothetical protein